IATAKPWGEGAQPPGASAATTSLVAEIAESSTESAPPPGVSAATASLLTETDQPVFIVVQPGDSPVTYIVECTEDPRASPPVVGIAERAMGDLTEGLVCTSVDLRGLEVVLPSPSAP
ncbi:MAG: hypothetical protein ABSE70_07995, partial [Candidatus Limnocylindrales bacterium]